MKNIKNILVAVDFSDCSKAALAQAARIAGRNGARLQALHVLEPLGAADADGSWRATSPEANSLACRQAHARLAAWAEEAGGRAEVSVVVGRPLQEVLTRVRTLSADLLVAGARGSSTPDHRAGRLAAKLVRKAPSKVLLVSVGGTVPFRKAVVGVDFSPASALAVEQAARVTGCGTGEIHCLHVFDPPWERLHYRAPTPEATPDFQRQYTNALQGRLQEFVDRRKALHLRCVLLPWCSYRQGIARYAREVKAELVILGTSGHRCLRHLLLGSTAERLLRELPCSVLTVRPGDTQTLLQIP